MSGVGCSIPAFLNKLKVLVDDPRTDELIYWDSSGRSFHIRDGNRLAKEVLPRFFKHNNLSSFIRQLNMYGFRKINRSDPALTLSSEAEDMEFSHQYFLRNNNSLLGKIHRKPPSYNFASNLLNSHLSSGPTVNSSTIQDHVAANGANRIILGTEFNRLSELVRQMRARQESTTQHMHVLRSENQLIYREMAHLRNQLEQQGQLIHTLFNFLSAIASEGRNSGIRIGAVKRKLALTGTSTAEENPKGLIYKWKPENIIENTRLVASNPQIQNMLFSQTEATLPSTSDSSSILRTNGAPRLQVISSPNAQSASVHTSRPILAIQDAASSPKRQRAGSAIRCILPKDDFNHSASGLLSPTERLSSVSACENFPNSFEGINDLKPFHYDTQHVNQLQSDIDENFERSFLMSPSDFHLPVIESSTSSDDSHEIADFSSVLSERPQSAADNNIAPVLDLSVLHSLIDAQQKKKPNEPSSIGLTTIKTNGRKSSIQGFPILSSGRSSPTLTNIHNRDGLSPFCTSGQDISSLLLGVSPQKSDDNHSLQGNNGAEFYWDDVDSQLDNEDPLLGFNDPEALLANEVIPTVCSPVYSFSKTGRSHRHNKETSAPAITVTNPSQPVDDDNAFLDSLFDDAALKSITPSIPSPDIDLSGSLMPEC